MNLGGEFRFLPTGENHRGVNFDDELGRSDDDIIMIGQAREMRRHHSMSVGRKIPRGFFDVIRGVEKIIGGDQA